VNSADVLSPCDRWIYRKCIDSYAQGHLILKMDLLILNSALRIVYVEMILFPPYQLDIMARQGARWRQQSLGNNRSNSRDLFTPYRLTWTSLSSPHKLRPPHRHQNNKQPRMHNDDEVHSFIFNSFELYLPTIRSRCVLYRCSISIPWWHSLSGQSTVRPHLVCFLSSRTLSASYVSSHPRSVCP